jgi:hypothetical protein
MESRAEQGGLDAVVAACTSCSSVRKDAEQWQSLDAFLHDRFGLTVQRCLCPECLQRFYPELAKGSGQDR